MTQRLFVRKLIVAQLLVFVLLALAGVSWAEVSPKYYAVEASASVQTIPPQVTISWPSDPRATAYTIHRKARASSSWTPTASLQGSALSYVDSDVLPGNAYEYQITRSTSYGYNGYGYLYAAIQLPVVDDRGKVILIVDKTHAADLSGELARLQQDLNGDGWTVIRHDVSPQDSPPKVKALIKADYDADRANVRTVFLFGHIAVPYSGNFNPDGHPDHQGAWPADAFYGDMDGNWTDNSVNTTSAERPRNRNVPGDGKFDQSELPSDVELEVGRVDLSNMTNFANKTPSRNERDLLRQYLNKDHNFRHGRIDVERRGLICDNFGERDGEAFAASGWRNFAVFFGANNVAEVPGWNYFSTVSSKGYLWSYGTGGGSFYTCNGIGSSDDFATTDIKTVFTMFLGSYFGDWDNESNFLRSPLGSTSYTLTASWSGRPHWFYHHMGSGETIGYSTRLSQNNGPGGAYAAQNTGTRQVHVALMGDPTLRMHPVIPPSNVRGTVSSTGVTLSWQPSTDSAVQGYLIYRSESQGSPFSRITRGAPIAETNFSDLQGTARHVYMVRAIKLERSGSGTYLNPSQGVFFAGDSAGAIEPAPVASAPAAPSGFSAVAAGSTRVNLNWIDNANNESGIKLERKAGLNGTYQQIAILDANTVTFGDGGLTPGNSYVYRLSAFNAAGASPFSNEATIRLDPGVSVAAKALFVRVDSATRGNWKNVFGVDGFHIIGDAVTYPGYAVVTSNGNNRFEWGDSTSDARALWRDSGADRVPACWYADSNFEIEMNFIDGKTHQLALYCLDWDTTQRSEKIEVLDAASNGVLDTRTVSNFNGGHYLVWNVQGSFKIRFSRTSGNNAVLTGMFFDPAGTQLGNDTLQPPVIAAGSAQAIAQGRFQLRIQGKAGQRFVIQTSNDLSQWTSLTTVTLSSSSYDFMDTEAARYPKRFYRALVE